MLNNIKDILFIATIVILAVLLAYSLLTKPEYTETIQRVDTTFVYKVDTIVVEKIKPKYYTIRDTVIKKVAVPPDIPAVPYPVESVAVDTTISGVGIKAEYFFPPMDFFTFKVNVPDTLKIIRDTQFIEVKRCSRILEIGTAILASSLITYVLLKK